VSSNFYKKDANFHQNPKVLEAGFWGATVYDALLALNRQHRCEGHIRPRYCRPEYLAWYVGLIGEQSWINKPAIEAMRHGLLRASKAKLITMSELGVKIVGWGPDWADSSSAERMRRWRDNRKVTPVTSRAARGEERRGEDLIPDTRDPPGPVGPGDDVPISKAGTRRLAEAMLKRAGLQDADDDDTFTGVIGDSTPPAQPESPPRPGKASKRKTRAPAPAAALQAALLLVGYVADNTPDGKIAQLTEAERLQRAEEWADPIRLLHERDQIPYPAIEAMIAWSQTHEFWRGVILSGANLRAKWDTMAAQRGRGARASASTSSTGPAAPTAHDDHPDGDQTL
jgi:hypothetical protein